MNHSFIAIADNKLKRKALNKINNSNELLELIKAVSTNSSNWNKGKDTLVVRISLGAKRFEDKELLMEGLSKNGNLMDFELECSQDPKDDPRARVDKKKQATDTKSKSRLVDAFIHRLFNDPSSPFHFGFFEEMANSIKTTLCFDEGSLSDSLIWNDEFPPNEQQIKEMLKYTVTCPNMEGLLPVEGKYPPHKDSETKPPTLNQWKRTKEGHEHVMTSKGRGNGQSSNGFKKLFDLTSGKIIASDMNASSTSTCNNRRGQVEIDTGRKVTKIMFFASVEDLNASTDVHLEIKMLDLVSKARRWKQYNSDTHQRIFHILAKDGSIFSTYTKEELSSFTLDHIIKVMNYPEGEILKIKADIKLKEEFDSDDEFDTLSK